MKYLFAALFGLLLLAAPAGAQMSLSLSALDLLDSKADFSGDYQLASGRSVYRGHIFHSFHRERWEFSNGGSQQILLLRRDLNEAAMLWPEKRWYMSSSFAMASSLLGGLGSDVLNARQSGIEKLGEEIATRYHVDKGTFVGDIWRTQDGIVIKAKGIVTYNGNPTEGTLDIYNLQRVRPDAALFVRPEGYLGLPFNFSGK